MWHSTEWYMIYILPVLSYLFLDVGLHSKSPASISPFPRILLCHIMPLVSFILLHYYSSFCFFSFSLTAPYSTYSTKLNYIRWATVSDPIRKESLGNLVKNKESLLHSKYIRLSDLYSFQAIIRHFQRSNQFECFFHTSRTNI